MLSEELSHETVPPRTIETFQTEERVLLSGLRRSFEQEAPSNTPLSLQEQLAHTDTVEREEAQVESAMKPLLAHHKYPLSAHNSIKADRLCITQDRLQQVSCATLSCIYTKLMLIRDLIDLSQEGRVTVMRRIILPFLTIEENVWAYLNTLCDDLLREFPLPDLSEETALSPCALAEQFFMRLKKLPPSLNANLLYLVGICAREAQAESLITEKLNLTLRMAPFPCLSMCKKAHDRRQCTPFETFMDSMHARLIGWEAVPS